MGDVVGDGVEDGRGDGVPGTSGTGAEALGVGVGVGVGVGTGVGVGVGLNVIGAALTPADEGADLPPGSTT